MEQATQHFTANEFFSKAFRPLRTQDLPDIALIGMTATKVDPWMSPTDARFSSFC
jgi:hypothetical protein